MRLVAAWRGEPAFANAPTQALAQTPPTRQFRRARAGSVATVWWIIRREAGFLRVGRMLHPHPLAPTRLLPHSVARDRLFNPRRFFEREIVRVVEYRPIADIRPHQRNIRGGDGRHVAVDREAGLDGILSNRRDLVGKQSQDYSSTQPVTKTRSPHQKRSWCVLQA